MPIPIGIKQSKKINTRDNQQGSTQRVKIIVKENTKKQEESESY